MIEKTWSRETELTVEEEAGWKVRFDESDAREREPHRASAQGRRQPGRAQVCPDTGDWAPGGIGIQCTTSLNVHSRHLFTLGIGERIERVRGEVRWCRMMGNKVLPNGEVEPVYLAGIVFLSQAGSQRTHSLLALLSLLLA
jgi:hypothetical protein